MTVSRPLALITGASSGIGYQLARQFTTNRVLPDSVKAAANRLLSGSVSR